MSNKLKAKIETNKSLAASFKSAITTIDTVDNVGYVVATSGVTDNQGSFGAQYRAFVDVNKFSEWVTLTLSTTPVLNDADDTFLINLNQLLPGQVRLLFDVAGGAPDGTCNVWVSGKQLGRG